jgi:putative transposase
VRVKAVRKPGEYAWSSYRATAGLEPVPQGLNIGWLLSQFARTKPVARKRYADFVLSGVGLPSPWRRLMGQVLLGSDQFVERFAPHLTASKLKEKARRKQRAQRPTLKKLLSGIKTLEDRNQAMASAYLDHGYTLAEIGDAAGLHYATVSRIIKAVEAMS